MTFFFSIEKVGIYKVLLQNELQEHFLKNLTVGQISTKLPYHVKINILSSKSQTTKFIFRSTKDLDYGRPWHSMLPVLPPNIRNRWV